MQEAARENKFQAPHPLDAPRRHRRGSHMRCSIHSAWARGPEGAQGGGEEGRRGGTRSTVQLRACIRVCLDRWTAGRRSPRGQDHRRGKVMLPKHTFPLPCTRESHAPRRSTSHHTNIHPSCWDQECRGRVGIRCIFTPVWANFSPVQGLPSRPFAWVGVSYVVGRGIFP